jgi:RHS repeat-associated protein
VTIDSTAPPGSLPSSTIRFQLDDHLGSACLELDDAGAVITYEEYYPYGSTSYQAGRSLAEVGLKRHRYSGKERDEETGLNYHGARYYATWLGRWLSCDPAELSDKPCLYRFARDNPIRLTDPTGTDSVEEEGRRRNESLAIQTQASRSPSATLFEARDQAVQTTNKLILQVIASGSLPAERVPTEYGKWLDAIGKANVRQAIQEGRLPSAYTTSPTVGLSRGFPRAAYEAPDIWDRATGVSWDFHTPNSGYFYLHETKYLGQTLYEGTTITKVNPLFYFRF